MGPTCSTQRPSQPEIDIDDGVPARQQTSLYGVEQTGPRNPPGRVRKTLIIKQKSRVTRPEDDFTSNKKTPSEGGEITNVTDAGRSRSGSTRITVSNDEDTIEIDLGYSLEAYLRPDEDESDYLDETYYNIVQQSRDFDFVLHDNLNLGTKETMTLVDIVNAQAAAELHNKELPEMKGWLYKMSPRSWFAGWQYRYFVVVDYMFYWAKEEIPMPRGEPSPEWRGQFVNFLSLVVATNINAYQTSENNEFQIVARDNRHGHLRTYKFKCETQKERDHWVNGLLAHKTHMGNIMQAAANTTLRSLNVDTIARSSTLSMLGQSSARYSSSSTMPRKPLEYYDSYDANSTMHEGDTERTRSSTARMSMSPWDGKDSPHTIRESREYVPKFDDEYKDADFQTIDAMVGGPDKIPTSNPSVMLLGGPSEIPTSSPGAKMEEQKTKEVVGAEIQRHLQPVDESKEGDDVKNDDEKPPVTSAASIKRSEFYNESGKAMQAKPSVSDDQD